MPRVKNTARKSTGGKAPRRLYPGGPEIPPVYAQHPPGHPLLYLVRMPKAVDADLHYGSAATKDEYSHVDRLTRDELRVLDGYVRVYKGALR